LWIEHTGKCKPGRPFDSLVLHFHQHPVAIGPLDPKLLEALLETLLEAVRSAMQCERPFGTPLAMLEVLFWWQTLGERLERLVERLVLPSLEVLVLRVFWALLGWLSLSAVRSFATRGARERTSGRAFVRGLTQVAQGF